MKHAATGSIIIPKIAIPSQGDELQWVYIAEKVYINGEWIKVDYYSTNMFIFPCSNVHPGNSVNNVLSIAVELIV